MKDYYEILEVNKNASDDTIKKVFRLLIKKNHPDLFEGEEKQKAEEKVKELNEAYEILSNKDSREKYDEDIEQNLKNNDTSLQVVIEENEYLKSIIREKNKLIEEMCREVGINVQDTNTNAFYDEEVSENDNENNIKVDMTEGARQYKMQEYIKKLIGMTAIIIFGIVFLWIITGINIFKILIDIFKMSF